MYGIHLEDLKFFGGTELKVFIDGELVDQLQVTGEIREGQTLESPAITRALEGREVTTISFVGTMVVVYTEPEIMEEENENG